MKILLVSHGSFAEGMCQTLTSFFGATNVYYACVTQENGISDLLQSTDSFLSAWGEETVVICSDLKGGSANQSIIPYMNRPNTYIISGMNLSLIMQLMLEDDINNDLLHELIDLARADMDLINDSSFGTLKEDDE